jgi:hypothetical protein
MAITSVQLSAASNVSVQLTNRMMQTYYSLERGKTIELQQIIEPETLFSMQPDLTGVSIITLLLSENNRLILDRDQSPDWESREGHDENFVFVFRGGKVQLAISFAEIDSQIIIVGTVPTPNS